MIDKTKLKPCTYHRSGYFEVNHDVDNTHYNGFVDPNKIDELYDENYNPVPMSSFSIDQEYYDLYCKKINKKTDIL